MSEQRLSELVAQFQQGQLSRDDYWKAMQQQHRLLQDYCQLISASNIQRIEIAADGLYLVLHNGLSLTWDPEDIRTAPNMLLSHGSYEPAELALLEQLGDLCQVVFDIGANQGWYSLHLGQGLQRRQGRVYAFEPIPQTYAALVRNIELNQAEHTVRAFNLAFGECHGQARFFVPSFTGSVAASQRALFPEDQNQTLDCQLTTLDAFIAEQGIEQLDLIKCDVEGSELFVLRGGLQTIERFHPILMLEMLRKWAHVFNYHPNDIIALLSPYGYRCYSYEQNRFVEVSSVTEECVQTNFFFFHRPTHNHLIPTLLKRLSEAAGRHSAGGIYESVA